MLNTRIIATMNLVRSHYPEVTHVVFFSPDVWNWYTDDMYAPPFDGRKVGYEILQNAADSLEPEHFPFVYKHK